MFLFTRYSLILIPNLFFYIIWGAIYLLNTDWIFKGIGQIIKQSKVFTFFNLLALIGIFIYFKTQSILPYNTVVYITKITPLLLGSIILLNKLRGFNYPILRIGKSYLNNYKFNKTYFIENSYFSLGGVLARVYNASGLLILGFFISIEEIGLLSYAFLVYTIFSMGRGIIISTLFPYICDVDANRLKNIVTKSNLLLSAFYLLIFFVIITPFSGNLLNLIVPSGQLITSSILKNFNLCFILIGINCLSFFNISAIQSIRSGKTFTYLMILGITVMLVTLFSAIYLGLKVNPCLWL